MRRKRKRTERKENSPAKSGRNRKKKGAPRNAAKKPPKKKTVRATHTRSKTGTKKKTATAARLRPEKGKQLKEKNRTKVRPSSRRSLRRSSGGLPPHYADPHAYGAVLRQESYALPSRYEETYLRLIVKDAFWIFAYWEISETARRELCKRKGLPFEEAHTVLRLYDVTFKDFYGTNANTYFDIDVGPYADNWYIHFWKDNTDYCADIGLKVPDGHFYSLARSNFVKLPRAHYSWRAEQVWMEVTDTRKDDPYVFATPRRTGSRLRKGSGRAGRARRISISEEELKAYYKGLAPSLRAVLGKKLHMPDSSGTPDGDLLCVIEGEGGPARRRILTALPGRQYLKEIRRGSELMILSGGSEQIMPGASERITGRKEGEDFSFEVGTELIVYGKTEPDAEVRLGDSKIELDKDGTFTLRYSLPDGLLPFDFHAVSRSGRLKKQVRLSVQRVTHIRGPRYPQTSAAERASEKDEASSLIRGADE